MLPPAGEQPPPQRHGVAGDPDEAHGVAAELGDRARFVPADVTDDRRVARNYPEQPPVIPHNVRDYQLNLNTNRCLTCHSRQYTEAVQAPMISITHYLDREGQTLGAVSPRRYFCMQCHVPQTAAQPLVPNMFQNIDSMISRPSDGGEHK